MDGEARVHSPSPASCLALEFLSVIAIASKGPLERERQAGRVGFRKFRGLGGISYLYGGFPRHTSMATRLILPRGRGPFTYDVCTRRGMGVYHNHPGNVT